MANPAHQRGARVSTNGVLGERPLRSTPAASPSNHARPVRFGMRRIATSADGTFELTPGVGEWAMVLLVHNLDGDLDNFVAWHVDGPGRWSLYDAGATFILGAHDLGVAAYFGDPIEIHATPQAWALAGGRGVCVLRWDVDLRDWFEGVKRVDSHPAVAARLRQNFRTWEPATRRRRHAA